MMETVCKWWRICLFMVLAGLVDVIVGGTAAAAISPAAMIDTASRGSWVGVYGADGYVLLGFEGPSSGSFSTDRTNLPSYITNYSTTYGRWLWVKASADTRALQDPTNTTTRNAGCGYGGGTQTITFTPNQTKVVKLGIYSVDWDSQGRSHTISFSGAGLTGSDSVSSFGNGQWNVYTVTLTAGTPVVISVTYVAGTQGNAVISAVTFDPYVGPPTIQNAAATNVLASSAWLNGNLSGTNGSPSYVSVYWDTNDWTTNTASWGHTNVFAGTQPVGPLSYHVTGLNPSTTYWYAYAASNGYGVSWAQTSLSFRTLSGAVSVTNGGFESPGNSGLQEPMPAGNGWSLIKSGSGSSGLWRPIAPEALMPVEGSQYGYGYGFNGAASAVTLYQQVADVLLSYRTYTLSVWVGDSTTYAFPGLVRLGLYNSTNNAAGFFTATPLAVTNITTTPGNGQGRYYTASFVTGGSPPLGPLIVGLSVSNGVDSAVRLAVFDDVTVTATVLIGAAPVIANSAATNVLATSAWLNGSLTASNGAATYVSVFWGTNDWTTNSASWACSNVFPGAQAEGGLTFQATGLSSNTTHWYAYYGSNAYGTAWAQPSRSFKTMGQPAVGNAAGATSIAASNAVLNGVLTDGGSAKVFIYWWVARSGVTNLIDFGAPRAEGGFSTNLWGLTPLTDYGYRCFASNAYGTAWAATATNFTTRLPNLVTNGGFEADAVAVPTNPATWTYLAGNPAGWTFISDTNVGAGCEILRPGSAVLPPPVEGVQYADNWLYPNGAATYYQRVGAAFLPYYTYTLTAWIGHLTNYAFVTSVRLGLYNSTNNASGWLTATPLAVTNITADPGVGQGLYCTASFKTDGAPPVGPVIAGLSAAYTNAGLGLVLYDDVTVTMTAIWRGTVITMR